MLKSQLLELGFTPNQAEVYLALTALGKTKVGPILKKTGFHRNIVYRALQELGERGLVRHAHRQGIMYFDTANPEMLVHEIEQKRSLAQIVAKELKRKQRLPSMETALLMGFSGIKQLTDDILVRKEDFCIWGENGTLAKRYPEHFRSFHEQRIAKRIYVHTLAQPRPRGMRPPPQAYSETGALPYPLAPALVIWLYADTIVHIITDAPELMYVLNHKKIAESFRDYFTLLWREDRTRTRTSSKKLKFI